MRIKLPLTMRVDSEEGTWNDPTRYEDGYNTGHRPRTKGGYFPVQPTDSMVDLRAKESVTVLEEIGVRDFCSSPRSCTSSR